MTCGGDTYAGRFRNGLPDGPVAAQKAGILFLGGYRAGKANGLGGDTAQHAGDAYEGEYKDGARVGFGVERDKDGVYPGRFGFYVDPKDKSHRIDMALSGRQDFPTAHWVGSFGAYLGPRDRLHDYQRRISRRQCAGWPWREIRCGRKAGRTRPVRNRTFEERQDAALLTGT